MWNFKTRNVAVFVYELLRNIVCLRFHFNLHMAYDKTGAGIMLEKLFSYFSQLLQGVSIESMLDNVTSDLPHA